MTFSGSKVRQYRDRRGMTQGELAEKAGVTQSFISDMEGNKKAPSTRTMILIAEALGVKLDALLEG